MKGTCPRCWKQTSEMTWHHWLPVRWFKKNPYNKVALCRDCHDLIEKKIPHKRKLKRREYESINRDFMHGTDILVKE